LNLPVINKEKFPERDEYYYREYDFREACCPVWKGKARPDWNPALYTAMFDKDHKLLPYWTIVEGGFTRNANASRDEFYPEDDVFGARKENIFWREEGRRQELEFLRLVKIA
jgi:hypothetical protein